MLIGKEKNKTNINRDDIIIRKNKVLNKMNLNKENKINISNILENKNQTFIIPLMLSHLEKKGKFETIRYN